MATRLFFNSLLMIGVALVSRAEGGALQGPLRVHPVNPRYFTDGSGRAIYLTGSHTWANLVERRLEGGRLFNFREYLDFLEGYHHNFIRLWAWEHAAWMQFSPPEKKILYHPHPYPRTGPGKALDGQPKFDLSRFNEDYFQRLRSRVAAAGERGIYVAVMLFQGFSIEQKGTEGVDPRWGNPWNGHPFNRQNNINLVDGDPNGNGEGEETHTLQLESITRLQEAYVRKVIDTVNDLDNVLYEISNESHGDSTAWQYHMIRFIKDYEQGKPKQHPVGMTFQYGQGRRLGTNLTLFESPADWISPNPEGGYRDDPPVAEGRKIVLSDTDHLWGLGGNVDWVWKTFARGHQPIFMDPYKDVRSSRQFSPRTAHKLDRQWDPIRRNLGYTRQFAERMDLAKTLPISDASVCSTHYCLCQPGAEYLLFQPNGGPFTLSLETGSYRFEWFNPRSGKILRRGQMKVAAGKQRFVPPFRGSAVLYMTREAD